MAYNSSPSTSNSDTPTKTDLGGEYTFNKFFHYSSYHARDMTRETSCVIELPNGTKKTVSSNDQGHAEVHMRAHVEKYLKDEPNNKNITIKCWQNYSPCSHCAEQLVAFVDKHKYLTIHIRLATLYNVNRESCRVRNCTSHVANAVSNENKRGLKYINGHPRLKIMFFEWKHWEELAELLDYFKLTDDMYGHKKKEKFRSRLEEDELVASDYRYIVDSTKEK